MTSSNPKGNEKRSGSTFFWTGGGGLFALAFAVFVGFQAATRHSIVMWIACVGLVVAALLGFTGALLERRRLRRRRETDSSD
ncbi:hypothetical protein [Leifsonia sp. WHRI 6310E]|uniref:hypothetical protein n=1 Tax=Leifsonia sp. WHRI 6310E TaxID=3162562 RepID=UPI0032EEFABB